MAMRIGIFGGSFDPVHLGHQLVAQAALEELRLDRVFFVPAAQSPFKPDRQLAPAATRVAMLRLALAGKIWAEVDLQEIGRGGISYSIDTVRGFGGRFPGAELFYLIGADHVAQLPKWRDSAELGKLATFVIIPRPGEARAETPPGFKAQWLKGHPLGVSASGIRARVKAGLAVDLLTGERVAEAIRNNRLYL
jgi:nicotinate-nucleotide adenylyltransferase